MVNGVFDGVFFFWKTRRILGKFSCLVKTVPPLCFSLLNVPMYGVSNLSSVKFFVDKNVLFFGLIVTIFFCVLFYFHFCLALVIFIPIVTQLFFIFVANVDAVLLVVGPISIVFNIVPSKISCGNYFKFSLYDLLIAICVVGNNSIYLFLLFFANNLNYCSNVWFIRSVWPCV